MVSNEIMVSIACITYNHEKYIREALESFVRQKTDFRFEVLVHDDASTDGTQEIIKEYADRYPDIIKPILQKENQFSKGKKILWELVYPLTKGKYVALCEGDDYWTDENKLQKQFDELEKHPDSVFCIHRVRCITEAGKNMDKTFPGKEYGDCITSEEFMSIICYTTEYFQTSSYFFSRRIIADWINNIPKFIKCACVGDTPMLMLAITQGSIRYINEEMSCYRMVSESSFSNQIMRNRNGWITFYERTEKSFGEFDSFSNYRYTDMIGYVRLLYQFKANEEKRNYLSLLLPKYRPIWKQFPRKEKLYRIIRALCPCLIKIRQN